MIIDVTYGEGWDAASRMVLGPISREHAANRDATGERYAVVLRERGRPQPVAVLNIAWAHDYLGVWAYDDQGRRTRELDLRRLEPDRLLLRHIAQWRYDSDDMAEFADRVGRVLIDLYPDGRGRKVSEPKGIGGGSLHTLADVPDEQRWAPAPAFGDWAWAVAMATDGHVSGVSLRDAPVQRPPQDGPAEDREHGHATAPGWCLPSPLRPRYLDEMFTPGTRFTPPDTQATGPYVVERVVDAGSLRLPTGRIVACDPGWLDPGEPFTVAVPPGSYRMQIATAAYRTEHWGKTLDMQDFTAARILISGKPTATWELALRLGEDPRTLRDGEFYGFGVDTGTGCFVDAAAADRLTGGENTVPDDDSPDGIVVLDDPTSGGNLIVYPSGMGDGSYPVWIGRDADGEVTCLVADMLILRHQELLPNRSQQDS
ncbi:DUF4241 domain-containing protein [Streptomyces sp. WMMC940]|uniref:DUF4241 domain-containing protein n=1 Tax=Streptomyces sp. WMMC940 TaxID=3015153 RepID=UPI0022B6B856|nr:DUF4241 domain-containing protein [Streptomyces sp. WMMC940]MCZ7457968.1 DUF4241 domain-containing protein [Streptomyces sp. WMMC940]